MFESYEKIFDARGDSYNQATAMCPNARYTERQLLLDRLNLKSGLSLCDIPAGGGYVADGIDSKLRESMAIVCLEPSFNFAQGLNKRHTCIVSKFNSIPLSDNSFDRVSSLAGIHHLADKQLFFNDVARVLKPKGVFTVADVQANTPPALFLNDAVDRLTDTGHDGVFLEAGELTKRLKNAGFSNITEELISFSWDFPDEVTLIKFCHQLFCLSKATYNEVKQEIENVLQVTINNDGAKLMWSLIYASGRKL